MCSLIIFLCVSCGTSENKENQSIRIVSLSPAVSSILIALGQEKKIAGAVKNDFFVSAEKVGNLVQFSLEKIISLKPTHIIYQDFQKNWISPIQQIPGIQFLEVSFTNIDSILKTTQSINEFLKLKNNVLELKKVWLNKIKNQEKELDFSYLAIVDRGPDFKQVFAAGKESYLSELLLLMGGKNLAESSRDYVQISEEYLLSAKKIDVILDFSLGNQDISEFHHIPVVRINELKMTVPDLNFEEKIDYLKNLLNKILKNTKKSQFS